jgi:hypothetical protein
MYKSLPFVAAALVSKAIGSYLDFWISPEGANHIVVSWLSLQPIQDKSHINYDLIKHISQPS